MPLQIIRQDITKTKVDAIVNTTNRGMVGFSGVDLAVHEAAGAELDEYCRKIAPIEKGIAVVTDGYNLSCKYIIHTVGPVWEGGEDNEEAQLISCYRECLKAALDLGCETVAFPLISSGAYGYPKSRVLGLAVKIITEFLIENEMTVYLCVFDRSSYEFSKKLFSEICSFIDDNYVDEHTGKLIGEYNSLVPPKGARMREPLPVEPLCEITFTESLREDSPYGGSSNLSQWIENMDKSFAETLFSLIDEKGMSDSQCYNKANVSRKTFSKIRCDKKYRPSKETAIAFAIALELNLEETEAFLKTAGLALSDSFKFDVIIKFFITKGEYDMCVINTSLFEFDQPTLGC